MMPNFDPLKWLAVTLGATIGFLVYVTDWIVQVAGDPERSNMPLYIILIFLVVVKGLEINMSMINAVVLKNTLTGIERILVELKSIVGELKDASANK